jgi:hypothetical protein
MKTIRVTATFTAREFARTLELFENSIALKETQISNLPAAWAELAATDRDALFSAYRKFGGYKTLTQLVTNV